MKSGDRRAKFDLQAYLERIHYAGRMHATAEALHALHLAHATHIPFENLDVLCRRPIQLDIGSLQKKLVDARRGGYCFEQNLLFATALEALGFCVKPLAARVRLRTARILPRTHMLLLVEADGARWLADVGFGGEGLLLPVSLAEGQPASQFRWTYRLVTVAGEWLLQSKRGDRWVDLYSFSEEPQEPADFEMANYYVSTHPDSRFVQTLTVQLPTPERRHILRDMELTTDCGDLVEVRTLVDARELVDVLKAVFHLSPPSGLSLTAGVVAKN